MYHQVLILNKSSGTYVYIQGPVVQSIVSLTSSLVVKMLTILVSTIPNSQVFLLEKKLLTFFSKNISIYAMFNDQSFNDTLTNDIVRFEQLSPDEYFLLHLLSKIRWRMGVQFIVRFYEST